jgi:hypothetical protein
MGVWCDSIIERQPRIKDNAGAYQQKYEAKKVNEKKTFLKSEEIYFVC